MINIIEPIIDHLGNIIYKNKIEQYHCEYGPAIEDANGTKWWYLNGQLHREDGPAVEYADGSKEWYLNGQLHREDGPAVEYPDDSREWHLNGICYKFEIIWKIFKYLKNK